MTTKKFHKEKHDLLERTFEEFNKLPKKEFNKLKDKVEKRYNKLLKKYGKDIKIIKNPLNQLDELLKKGYKIVFLTNSFYAKKYNLPGLPHFIVIYKKQNKNYFVMDSRIGNIKLTKKELQKGIDINRRLKIFPQLIAYKNKK